MQFLKFGLVGVMNTLISEGFYIIIVFFGGHYLVASIIGFVISVINAYYWNNRYVFKQSEGEVRRVWWKTLLKTYAAYAGGQLLNMALLVLWVDMIQIGNWFEWLANWFQGMGVMQLDARTIGEIVAAGLNLIVTVPLNYFVNKYWTFGKKKSSHH